jgi:hypothetical protein
MKWLIVFNLYEVTLWGFAISTTLYPLRGNFRVADKVL